MPAAKRFPQAVLALHTFLFAGLTVFLGFFTTQQSFAPLAIAYGAFFMLYVGVIRRGGSEDAWRWWMGVAIFLRILLLFTFPQLSDDIYRFLWDGHLVAAGYNPYTHLPSDWLQEEGRPQGLSLALYDQLNSRRYYTVYPPLAQLSFGLAALLAGSSWFWGAFVLKGFLLVFEGLTLWFLPRMLVQAGLPRWNALIYALNPLVILEGVGNLHYEVVVVALLLLSIAALYRQRWTASAIWMSLAVAAKLSPLMFLPFWLRLMDRRRLFPYFGVLAAWLALWFAPVLAGVAWGKIGQSLNLYFRKFEFNAGLFNLVKWVGFQVKGYNLIKRIGPFLALHTFLGIWIGAWVQRDLSMRGLLRHMLFALSLYLFLSTTVHSWYLIPLLAFSVFTDFRYPMVWTGMAILSYSHYMSVPFASRYGWLALEYLVVFGFFLREIRAFALGCLR